MKDLRQSDEYAEYLRLIGWKVIQSDKGVWVYVRNMPMLPCSILKLQRVSEKDLDLEWLYSIKKKEKVVLQYIELDSDPSKNSP